MKVFLFYNNNNEDFDLENFTHILSICLQCLLANVAIFVYITYIYYIVCYCTKPTPTHSVCRHLACAKILVGKLLPRYYNPMGLIPTSRIIVYSFG